MNSITITSDDFVDILPAINYQPKLLFKVYDANHIYIKGNVKIEGMPLLDEIVGNFTFLGTLDITKSNIKRLKINDAKYLYSTNSPYGIRKERIRARLLQRRLKSERSLDNDIFLGLYEYIMDENLYDIRSDIQNEYDSPEFEDLYDIVTGYYEIDNYNCFSITMYDVEILIGEYGDMYRLAVQGVIEIFEDAYDEKAKLETYSKFSRYLKKTKMLSNLEEILEDDDEYYRELAQDELDPEDDESSDVSYEERVEDYVKTLMNGRLEEFESDIDSGEFSEISNYLDINNYFDIKEWAEMVVDSDGIGHTLNHMDGTHEEYDYNGKTYVVVQRG